MRPIAERFWEKVNKAGPTVIETACWLWTSAFMGEGYGQFWLNRKVVKAHRVSYELTKGPIPPGMNLMHRCDNPPCVNPDHLVPGTDNDNIQDAVAKGRIRGHSQRYSWEVAEKVRALHRSGRTQNAIVNELGIGRATVKKMVRGSRAKDRKRA